jgi:hypothetical protein
VPLLLPPSLTPDGRAGPLSRLAVQTAAGWPVVLGAGALFLVAGAIRQGSGTRKRPPGLTPK